jgi:hypothetical protein
MKNELPFPARIHPPSEQAISDYAYQLYQQCGCVPGHAVENWIEATFCLNAGIPHSPLPPLPTLLRAAYGDPYLPAATARALSF